MMQIEVIGLEPPCKKCTELLENAKEAVKIAGIEAEVVKKWTLSEEMREKYGLLLSPGATRPPVPRVRCPPSPGIIP